jgi:hypothetical protein
MPQLIKNGVVLFESDKRADCYVAAFRRSDCVFDQHSRRRNQFLPGVKIVGEDRQGTEVDVR